MKLTVTIEIEAKQLGRLQAALETLQAQPAQPAQPKEPAQPSEPKNPSPTKTEVQAKVIALGKANPANKKKMKAKLVELGATSVSTLAEENYDSFMKYLVSLEES